MESIVTGAEPIVVGTDGSSRATSAVEWAADEAALLRRPLHILHAADCWAWDVPFHPAPAVPDSLAETGERILADAVESALKAAPGIDVTTEAIFETPSYALRAAAARAYELVVGHRGLGGFASLLLGSTGLRLAGHIPGAVVVVRGGAHGPRGEVLVGVAGTGDSAVALEYAFTAAAARGAWIRAVHAWETPATAGGAYPGAPRRAVASVADRLSGAVAPWRERFPGVRVVEQASPGHPVGELVTRSARADLLVVGASRHPGRLRLGSVGHGVIHHAHCPVAVVRPRS